MPAPLRQIQHELPSARLVGADGVAVSSVTHDSRRVAPGALFVAVPGFRTDGHDYLREAIAAGASAVVVQDDRRERWAPVVEETHVPAVVTPDARAALAPAAAAVHGHPARRLVTIGVTGTDGKTSTCHLIAHMLAVAGEPAGLMSTAEARIRERVLPQGEHLTTGEAPDVQALLAEMADGGCRYAIIESSSHGLALHRLDRCEFDVAVMTQVGTDHIDFHGSREAYIEAKALLFAMLEEAADKGATKTAVLNADDPVHATFGARTKARALHYGRSLADVRATDVRHSGWRTSFTLETPAGSTEASVARPGEAYVYDALAGASVGLALELPLETVAQALRTWPGTPGRMERVDAGQPFLVVVDYAHSPESLRRALDLLRDQRPRRVLTLFGCVGGREYERRTAMGETAGALADFTIVTDDNPNDEDREAIIRDIEKGLIRAGRQRGRDYELVPDRREAVAYALAMAERGDALLLAGKGHETRVSAGAHSYDCDDRELALHLLRLPAA
jgi:UDP-N-acetylmuramoyl-L-alanyl-D-glutamate--2,6-diaminopimelate ligase